MPKNSVCDMRLISRPMARFICDAARTLYPNDVDESVCEIRDDSGDYTLWHVRIENLTNRQAETLYNLYQDAFQLKCRVEASVESTIES